MKDGADSKSSVNAPQDSIQSKNRIKDIIIRYNLWFLLIIMVIISTIISKGVFITPRNIVNLLLQNSLTGILATGQFLVIMTAGIDLSVGSVLAAGEMLCAKLLNIGVGILPSFLACIGLTAFFGFLNGVLVSKGKIPAFIVTLAMMGIARSFARQITHSSSIWDIPAAFYIFGQGYIGPIPIPLLLWGVIFFFTLFLVARNKSGRYVYAIGANESAARLSGVRIDNIKILVYTLCGLFCAFGAIIFIGRTEHASPEIGIWYNLDSITPVLIGGVSLSGGVGTLPNVFLGVLIMGILTNLMNIINVNLFWQQIVKGIVLVAAVYFSSKYTSSSEK
jgi:ribose transport system permease protein